MKIQTYRQLPHSEQARLLKREGVFLADRFLTGNRIYLFTLYGFYVELFHDLLGPDRTSLCIWRIFEDTGALEVYLDRIDIRPLLSA